MQVSYGLNNSINFGRKLSNDELSDYTSTLSAAKNKSGQTGMSILIVHDSCLPQSDKVNTGVGHLSTKDSSEFFDFAKNYWGVNIAEVLPQGQLRLDSNVAYGGTALSLGNHQINPQLLTGNEYHNILTKQDFNEIVESNKSTQQDGLANYANVALDDSPQDRIVKKAFKNFQKLDENVDLKKKFHKYVQENNDWLEPKCVYKILSKKNNSIYFDQWEDNTEKNLYSLDEDTKKNKINEVLASDKEESEFFKFKQFIADEHLQKGKKNLNQKGIKLYGDCLIGFSKDEVWAYPKAFKQNHTIGWNLPALDYDTITNPDSASSKLLDRKVGLCAKRYDSIRFDVGWSYVQPVINLMGEHKISDKTKKYMGDKVAVQIENTVKRVKGNDFNPKDMIWEVEADYNTFNLFEGDKVIPPFRDRTKIYSSTYMHDFNGDKWGSNDAFLGRGWSPDSFVIGVGNHDPQPLRQIADDIPDRMKMPDGSIHEEYHKGPAMDPLSRILKIPREKLNNPAEFSKAKFAEPMMAKNNQMFYMDAFGRSENFDPHIYRAKGSYSYKISPNFISEYMNTIREGYGFNPMDALEKVFVAKGMDKTEPELFNKIVKYKNILLEPDKDIHVVTSKSVSHTLGNKVRGMIIGGTALAVVGGVLLYKNFLNKKKESNKQTNQNMQIVNSPIKSDTFSKFQSNKI